MSTTTPYKDGVEHLRSVLTHSEKLTSENEGLRVNLDAARGDFESLECDAGAVVRAFENRNDILATADNTLQNAIQTMRDNGREGWWRKPPTKPKSRESQLEILSADACCDAFAKAQIAAQDAGVRDRAASERAGILAVRDATIAAMKAAGWVDAETHSKLVHELAKNAVPLESDTILMARARVAERAEVFAQLQSDEAISAAERGYGMHMSGSLSDRQTNARHAIRFAIACLEKAEIDKSLYECASCSAKPGAPILCDVCLANRAAAGSRWIGHGPRAPHPPPKPAANPEQPKSDRCLRCGCSDWELPLPGGPSSQCHHAWRLEDLEHTAAPGEKEPPRPAQPAPGGPVKSTAESLGVWESARDHNGVLLPTPWMQDVMKRVDEQANDIAELKASIHHITG